jgi:Pyruvate/2-oxoacid:ferredoxin oxidoreductase delta subunit
MIMLTATTGVGVVLGLILHPRIWCCICPIGSIGNWVGRWRFPLKIASEQCTECTLCRKVCPSQVTPFKFKDTGCRTVKDGDCLKCGMCVAVCPKQALTLGSLPAAPSS